jgi:hypothetical protein
MAFEIPFEEPTSVVAGDRIQWKRTIDDYPPASWTLTYHLRANLPNAIVNLTATASGTDHYVDVSPDDSALWAAGDYFWEAYVTASGDRKKIGSGKIQVTPNFAGIDIPFDGRTQARKILDAINLVMKGRATHDQQRYVMQAVGRSVDRVPLADLLKFRDYWANEVRKEELASSGGRGKNVLIRFNR